MTGRNRYCDSGVHTLPSRDTHAQTTLGPTCRPCELRRSYRARGEADPGEERSGASGGQGGYLQLLFYGGYGAFRTIGARFLQFPVRAVNRWEAEEPLDMIERER